MSLMACPLMPVSLCPQPDVLSWLQYVRIREMVPLGSFSSYKLCITVVLVQRFQFLGGYVVLSFGKSGTVIFSPVWPDIFTCGIFSKL